MESRTSYDSDSNRGVSELFNGKLSLAEAIRRLRTRLLDLSARNRLLNYRHPKRRSIQFVDSPDLDSIFARLIDSKTVLITYVPEPPPSSYETKRPDAKTYAQSIGINTTAEFSSASAASSATNRIPKLQTIYYPTDLEKVCRRISTDARTVIEETGTNMLYLIFGFFEFYEREDSEKSMLAPLIAVPVTLEKDAIDQRTRTYQYVISYSGEDIHENETLREKLSQEFSLQLPGLEEEDEPKTYFKKLEKAIETKKKWKIKYQLSLGFLSFGKLALWQDLDTKKWPEILEHSLLNELFAGNSARDTNLSSADYEIDSHAQSDLPLIFDADSSQHSAIIDVMSGKNIVVNGPPGTGKSQTITNVIAAGLKAGKKILFVSDKLAALEVVRHRLNQANLGHFCLELHSHKTQKKKLLADLQDRIDQRFRSPQQFTDKFSSLKRHKAALNRYARLIGSRIGNELGLTVHQIFWRSERCRQLIDQSAGALQSLFLSDAPSWTYDDIEVRRSNLEVLAELYDGIGDFGRGHPWWGFLPGPLAPGDDEAIARILFRARSLAEALVEHASNYRAKTNAGEEPSLSDIAILWDAVSKLPNIPQKLAEELLPRMISEDERSGEQNRRLLECVIDEVDRARELQSNATRVLFSNVSLDFGALDISLGACLKDIDVAALSLPLNEIEDLAATAHRLQQQFEQTLTNGGYSFARINRQVIEDLDAKIADAAPLTLSGQSMKTIEHGSVLLREEHARLSAALKSVTDIASRFQIEFDGSPIAIDRFRRVEGIDGILPGVLVNETVIEETKRATEYLKSKRTIAELNDLHVQLHKISARIDGSLKELQGYAKGVGLPFDQSANSILELALFARIAGQAPADLLDYRLPPMLSSRAINVLTLAEEACRLEAQQRNELSEHFYLDSLPDEKDLRFAISVFRRGDGFLNLLKRDWRAAKALVKSFSKPTSKRKVAAEYEALLSRVIKWMGHREAFIRSTECSVTFGILFNGFETDFSKITRLCKWIEESQTEIMRYPGALESLNLVSVESRKILQLARLSPQIQSLISELDVCRSVVNEALGQDAHQVGIDIDFENWREYSDNIRRIADEIKHLAAYLGQYLGQHVSLDRALKRIEAAHEIQSISADLELLRNGTASIQGSVESLLPGLGSTPCIRWQDYLDNLLKLTNASAAIVKYAGNYAAIDSTLADLRNVLEAKVALDTAIEKIKPFGEDDVVRDWASYAAVVRRRLSAAAEVARLLTLCGKPGLPANLVLNGLNAQKEANALIQKILNDRPTIELLGETFRGFDTDLESLAGSLSWFESLAGIPAIRCSSLYPLLLSSDAPAHIRWAKHTLESLNSRRQELKTTIAELGDFGSVNWDDWISCGRNDERDEFATSLLKRHQFAEANVQRVLAWSKYNSQRLNCRQGGLGDFVDILEQKKIPPSLIGKAFDFVTYRSIGRSIYKSFPELERFESLGHEKTRTEYAKLDRELISLTGQSFAHEIDRGKVVPTGNSGYRASDLTEMELLRRELNKQRRHLPIRQLIKRAGRAIVALKPCFMMGPMSVAQYIEHGAVDFDMVVMDEASQLRPEEALGAVARGKQLVVVGDPKQLPPTNFFDRLLDGDEDDEDAPAVLGGSESILDICQQLFHPIRTLRWHYRSQHESLIAFSNHHFYNSQLLVFPSPFERNNRLGVRYRYVKHGIYKDRQNIPEALAVVDAIIDHMIKRPNDSLGVVTLNLTQRDLIEDLLDKKLRGIDETETFISDWEERGWPFFVKNLENVQGDERDVIFVSTTFGKAAGTDNVRQNFGPISRPDGWRRLNVLFTRARQKIELFTSMLPDDIIEEASTPLGTKALKDYLDYAKRGILTQTTISDREPDSDFEIAVKDLLECRGYQVVPQFGVAGFFIDLAVRNPHRSGEFLAAIECDGAKYHSSNSARDRDRIRQAILESLGWKDRIWRIWSTDWFYNPRKESERLFAFFTTVKKWREESQAPNSIRDLASRKLMSPARQQYRRL